MKNRTLKYTQIIADGGFTFILSNIIMIGTLGISLSWSILKILSAAKITTANAPADFPIVVLGKRLVEGKLDQDFHTRLNRVLTLYVNNKERLIFIVGGFTGNKNDPSEAQAGSNFLIQSGVHKSNLIIEDKSLHTLENLRNVRNMLTEQGTPFILVTNRYHLARSKILALGLGMQPILCSAEPIYTNTTLNFMLITKEAYLVHWYCISYIWSKLTKNKKILSQIQ